MWLTTGASRGMGISFTQAAQAAGHVVVAPGPPAKRYHQGGGDVGPLMVETFDVTSEIDVTGGFAAAAAERFKGHFEEMSPAQLVSGMDNRIFLLRALHNHENRRASETQVEQLLEAAPRGWSFRRQRVAVTRLRSANWRSGVACGRQADERTGASHPVTGAEDLRCGSA